MLFLGLFIGWIVLNKPVSKALQNLELVTGSPLPQSLGRTNIIILGTGGDGHDGPDLADSLMLASIRLDSGKTSLVSIPRDIWVPSLRAKINTAYHYGFEKQATTGGLLLAKSAVSEILNQPIHFAIKIDFSAFVQAVDILGGVDIDVEREFTDSEYPIPGMENDLCDGDPETKCRYETVRFTAGPQHMDGQRALKYVRSRHSTDPLEGTDFARSKRQEKVLAAIQAKLLSIKNLKNSEIYQDLYQLALDSVVTDITPQYYSTFFQLGLKMRRQPFTTLSIEDQLENPPISPKYDYQWVLIPKGGDNSALSQQVSSILKLD